MSFQAPRPGPEGRVRIWITNVFAVLGRGEDKEAAERHGALGLLQMDSLCPTWACAQPQPQQLPREAVNRPPHLLSFTSPHKPSLPHLSSPHKYHIHMPSDPYHSAHRPAPTQLRPASTYLSPLHTHTHTSLCGINTDPVGSGRAARGWEWELVFSLWQPELKAT